MEDSLAVTADIRPVIKWEQALLVLARADLTHKTLGQAQDARDDVGLERFKLAPQVCDQNPGVDVDQVTEAEHLRAVHKVLPVLKHQQKPLISRQPADHEVFLHTQQLLPEPYNSRQLGDDGGQRRIQLLQTDQRLPAHQTEVGESGLGHELGGKVPVVDDPGGGGGHPGPVTPGAVVTPGVVTQPGLGEAAKVDLALQAGELLLGETHLRADGEDEQSIPELWQFFRVERVEKGSDTPPAYLGHTLGVKEVRAELACVHRGDQVPQCTPTLLTEEDTSGGVNIVTRNDDVTQTLLLSWKLQRGS